jgi:ABC-2 type transport system permease protein
MASLAESLNWVPHVFSNELRKMFSYRVAFWVQYVLGAFTELCIAYFLWKAIFEQNGTDRMQGFTFHGILFYYVFAALGSKIVQGANRSWMISMEIYDGSLTRYLLYPLSYLGYCYVAQFARQVISAGQLLFGLGFAILIWGLPADLAITPASVLLGCVTALAAGFVLFMINSCLEMVAFWQDTVWNLMAMLRFIGSLLGGLLIPLAFFPAFGQRIAHFTPFPVVYAFPIRCFLGQVGFHEWLVSMGQLSVWGLFAWLLASWVWRRGTRRYSGVGI